MIHRNKSPLPLVVLICAIAVIALVLLRLLTPFAFIPEVIARLAFGWIRFPVRTLPLVSWNWDTVLSGSAGLILGLAAVHFTGKRFIEAWNRRVTFAVLVSMPVLFFASFMVPAIVGSVQALQKVPLAEDADSPRIFQRFRVLRFRNSLDYYRQDNPFYPERLQAVIDETIAGDSWSYEAIFPGAGLPVNSAQDQPLLVTAPYLSEGRLLRSVIHFDLSVTEIDARETGAIVRAAQASRRNAIPGPDSPAPERP